MTTLMADLVAQQQAGEEPGQYTTEKAKQLLAQILLPKQITGKLIEKYIRKAMRTGAWRKLPPQTKVLLYIAKRFPSFRSTNITQLLYRILSEIELQTIRGKALFYGILKTIKNQGFKIGYILKNMNSLLAIGISSLFSPFSYKCTT